MEWLKRNWFGIVSPIIVTVAFVTYLSLQSDVPSPETNLVERPYVGLPIAATGDITCSYPQVMWGNYSAGKITYQIPPTEKNPNIFTFSDIRSEAPKLKYIDATQTISEVQVIKLSEDDERVVLIEAGPAYIAIHTIFKNTGVSIYSKQVSLFGTPSGTMTFGTCIDS